MRFCLNAARGAVVAVGLLAGVAAHAASDLDYFKQFQFLKEVSDDGDGEITTQYRWLMGMQEYMQNGDPNRWVAANVDLVLLEDGTFVLTYRDMLKYRASASAPWQYMPLGDFCGTRVKGKWSVPEQLLLGGEWMTGSRATFDSRNAVKLNFLKEFRADTHMTGQSMILDYGFSMTSYDDLPPFCPKFAD